MYLRSIRHAYLSTAPAPRPHRRNASSINFPSQAHQHLTDPQRDSIDADTTLLLRDLTRSINNLSAAEDIRQETETKLLTKKFGSPNGVLWRWAAGGTGGVTNAPKSAEQQAAEEAAKTIRMVRETVLWYLRRDLKEAVETQRAMVEKRVEREREKEKSVLWKMTGGSIPLSPRAHTSAEDMASSTGSIKSNDSASFKNSYANKNNTSLNPSTEEEDRSIESLLTPQQLQLFAQENNSLLRHYSDTLSKVQHAEKSLLEISSLQQTLVSHLSVQGEMIEQLVTDAVDTDENVRGGNKQLKRASERKSTARLVFWGTVGICGFLIGWDLVF